jgi:hypothetical protein
MLIFVATVLFEVSIGSQAELIVPLFAKTARERLFEKLVCAKIEFATKHFGAFADFPTVEIDSRECWVLFQTHRIEVA